MDMEMNLYEIIGRQQVEIIALRQIIEQMKREKENAQSDEPQE
jgi:hypothetical protein